MGAARMQGFRLQIGALLLQSLIAIALFSAGIIALMMVSATAIDLVSQAHYRASASLLAERALAQLRLAGNDPGLRAAWASDGAAFLAWKSDVQATLPGAVAQPPSISIGTNGSIQITLRWRAPAESSSHQHVIATRMPI